jgi:acyl transferase domain-containing protein/acyl carrier protein/NRPS condensation-like uncharacterized protein
VAGFIKTLLILKHRLIPPNLHFETPNPEINFEDTPFVVNQGLYEWKRGEGPLRAGINSIGGGGTNVHVILEESPPVKPSLESRQWSLIMLSAQTEKSLKKTAENLEIFLREKHGINLSDAAYTLHMGRKPFQYRKMLLCSDIDEVVKILSSPGSGKIFTADAKETKPKIIFMFPGQGSQYVNMGLGLYSSEPVFRQCMDRCFDIFKSVNGYDIKEILYPRQNQETAAEKIKRTEICQPVILMFEYALAKLLSSWGIEPDAMIGYSFGEYTAACLSGVFALEDAVRLVSLRGRLMQQMPEGAMLSIPLPADELKPLLTDKLSIAIDNGPSCIVSGTVTHIDELEKMMKEKKYLCIRVSVSHAGHSTLMGPILMEFKEQLTATELKEPQIPYISNLTATFITAAQTMEPGYWIRHLQDTVRFAEGIGELLTIPGSIFVEIGPGRDLGVLLKGHKNCQPHHRIINLVRHEKEEAADLYYLLNRVGHLWLYGAAIDWKRFYANEKRCRIPLPTYNFQGECFAIKPASVVETGKPSNDASQKKTNIDDMVYMPVWKRSKISSLAETFEESQPKGMLLFMDQGGWGYKIKHRLEQEGYQVSLVRAGEAFDRLNQDQYCIHPSNPEDYEALFEELTASGEYSPPNTIIHLWGVTPLPPANVEPGIEEVTEDQENGFFSLIALAQALGKLSTSNHFQVKVVTNNMQDVIGEKVRCPGKAASLGPVKVIGHEYHNINCCLVDLVLPEPESKEEQSLLDQLQEEFKIKIEDKVIAYRRGHRWIQTFDPVVLKKPVNPNAGLREKGVYLVTGGLGGMGLILAQHLARQVKAKLILTGRSAFPEREDWDQWLLDHGPADKISNRINKIKEIEALGAEVQLFSVDVTNIQHMGQMIFQAKQRFGPLNGVIHAAGLPDGAMILRRTREISAEVLAPKITGTLVLYRLLQDMDLDFLVLCSSLASILPLPGQAAYAAGNAFLDAFVCSRVLKTGVSPAAIGWDRWENTGIAVIAEEQHKKLWEREMEGGITPGQGIEIFGRILNDQLFPHLVAASIDIKQGIRQYQTSTSLANFFLSTKDTSPQTIRQRPELSIEYVEPGNDSEQKLAEVWQMFLGLDRVGIHDNFFELGVNSLGILQVNAQINKVLGKNIPVVAMYSHPTVASLAKVLDSDQAGSEFSAKEEHNVEPFTSQSETREIISLSPAEVMWPGLSRESIEQIKSQFPFPIGDIYPCTPMQEGMLFHALYDYTSSVHYIQTAYRIRGKLDIDILKKSLNEILKRHSILRTVFVFEDLDRPMQLVCKERELDFTYKDLRQWGDGSDAEKEIFIKEFKEKERERPFNLTKDLLIRFSMFQVNSEEFEFILSSHHILLDAWSLRVLNMEFLTIYDNFCHNRAYHLPPVTPYRTYIQWLETRDKGRTKEYWRNLLKNYNRPVGIPRKRISNQGAGGYQREEFSFTLVDEKADALKELAIKKQVTLSVIFQAIWGCLLAKYNAQRDVVFGIVILGRPFEIDGMESMVGMFINTIPVRIAAGDQTKFCDLLQQVRKTALESEPHHYYSLVNIHAQTPLKQNLFDHLLTFLNFPVMEMFEKGEYGGVKIKGFDLEVMNTESLNRSSYNFDLVIELEDQIKLLIRYNRTLYDSNFMRRLASHIEEVVNQILENNEIEIKNIMISHDRLTAAPVIPMDYNDFVL